MPFVKKYYEITKEQNICVFVENTLGYTSKMAQKIVDRGRISQNAQVLKKGQKIKGRIAVLEFVPEASKNPKIIFENEDFFVLQKDFNLLTHPKNLDSKISLLDLARQHIITANPINRLDKETGGLVIFGKNKASEIALKSMFEKREIFKIYVAKCRSAATKCEMLEDYLHSENDGSDLGIRAKVVPQNAKAAKIATTLMDIVGEIAILVPFTGRTHQLRIQLASRGKSIKNDFLYGVDDGISRAYLDFINGKKRFLIFKESKKILRFFNFLDFNAHLNLYSSGLVFKWKNEVIDILDLPDFLNEIEIKNTKERIAVLKSKYLPKI